MGSSWVNARVTVLQAKETAWTESWKESELHTGDLSMVQYDPRTGGRSGERSADARRVTDQGSRGRKMDARALWQIQEVTRLGDRAGFRAGKEEFKTSPGFGLQLL